MIYGDRADCNEGIRHVRACGDFADGKHMDQPWFVGNVNNTGKAEKSTFGCQWIRRPTTKTGETKPRF
jgi:hypothetical protein